MSLKNHIRYLKQEIILGLRMMPHTDRGDLMDEIIYDLEKELLSAKRRLYNRIHKRYGFLFNRSALWVGVHYSPYNRRYCINLLPCVTLWFCCKGGTAPKRCKL